MFDEKMMSIRCCNVCVLQKGDAKSRSQSRAKPMCFSCTRQFDTTTRPRALITGRDDSARVQTNRRKLREKVNLRRAFSPRRTFKILNWKEPENHLDSFVTG